METTETVTISVDEYRRFKAQEAEIQRLSQQVQWLMERMRLSQKQRFGASSEQTTGQIVMDEVFNEAEHTASQEEAEEPKTQVKAHTRKPKRSLTAMVPEGLPVEEVVHELPENERQCPECGELMPEIGKEVVRTEVKIIPAQLHLVQHVVKKYACRNCEETSDHTPIKQAQAPRSVIEGGNASPEAVAHIAVQKYANGMPLYRTSGCSQRAIVIYDYRPDWSWKNPKEFLKDFKGYLHTDGYEGYHRLPDGIVVVGCWAHARRKFVEAVDSLPKADQENAEANKGITFIDRMFRLEHEWGDQGLEPETRKKMRESQARPVMEAFYEWVILNNKTAMPKSKLGQALSYALSQRKYLERYLLDGRLEISNNRAERSIKPFVIGRKNWLFSNTACGAKTSAMYYSLIETAKENGLNPFDYLTQVFRQAPNRYIGKCYDDLLPWNLLSSAYRC